MTLRRYSPRERMEKLASPGRLPLHPGGRIAPTTLYLLAELELAYGLDYFDTGVAAEALEHDGIVVSTDKAFDQIRGLSRVLAGSVADS